MTAKWLSKSLWECIWHDLHDIGTRKSGSFGAGRKSPQLLEYMATGFVMVRKDPLWLAKACWTSWHEKREEINITSGCPRASFRGSWTSISLTPWDGDWYYWIRVSTCVAIKNSGMSTLALWEIGRTFSSSFTLTERQGHRAAGKVL